MRILPISADKCRKPCFGNVNDDIQRQLYEKSQALREQPATKGDILDLKDFINKQNIEQNRKIGEALDLILHAYRNNAFTLSENNKARQYIQQQLVNT